VLLAIVAASLAAPLWAHLVADTAAQDTHVTETVETGGEVVPVVSRDGRPVGPTWGAHFFLGADAQGRDVMVRVLYGGRNSLLIGLVAALATVFLGMALGLLAGYAGGLLDDAISGVVNVMWAFPGILLGVRPGCGAPGRRAGRRAGPPCQRLGRHTRARDRHRRGALRCAAVRAQVLTLREQEFVLAARATGMRPGPIMFRELLPNLAPTLLVIFPLIVGNAIQLEAALSFLGIGVQPPEPSWGTLVEEGVRRIETARSWRSCRER
jgi:peptide/nickel transport system permease protein